jgi:hypothetical protein
VTDGLAMWSIGAATVTPNDYGWSVARATQMFNGKLSSATTART